MHIINKPWQCVFTVQIYMVCDNIVKSLLLFEENCFKIENAESEQAGQSGSKLTGQNQTPTFVPRPSSPDLRPPTFVFLGLDPRIHLHQLKMSSYKSIQEGFLVSISFIFQSLIQCFKFFSRCMADRASRKNS